MRDPERLDYEDQEAKNFKFNVVAVTPDGQEVRSAIEVWTQLTVNVLYNYLPVKFKYIETLKLLVHIL